MATVTVDFNAFAVGQLSNNAGWAKALTDGGGNSMAVFNDGGGNQGIAGAVGGGFTSIANRYTGTAFGNNQSAAIKMKAFNTGLVYHSVFCRSAGLDATFNAYEASTDGHNYFLNKIINNVLTGLTMANAGGVTGTFGVDLSVNAVMELRVSGTTLSFVIDNVVIDTATDAVLTSGQVGVGIYPSASNNQLYQDDFVAADLAGGGGVNMGAVAAYNATMRNL